MSTSHGKSMFGTIGACAAVCFVVAVSHAANADLLGHRAFYNMTLGSAEQGSGVRQVRGRMSLEVVDVCEGWTVDQRIALEVISDPGDEVQSYSKFLSWESKEGDRFSFHQKTWRNGNPVENVSGRAELDRNGAGTAVFTKPEAEERELPPGTLFPTQHTRMVIDTARVGQRYFVRPVFDGSALDDPSLVSAFIGLPEVSGETDEDGTPHQLWPIRLAYFSILKMTSEPEFEVGLLIRADGVADSVDIDYGDFTIHGNLDKIEVLPPDC